MRLTVGAIRLAPRTNTLVGVGRRHGRAPPGRWGEGELLRGDGLRFETDAERLRNTRAICGVRLGAIGNMSLLNVPCGAADLTGRVVEQRLLLLLVHFPEQIARLLPVIVI